MKHCFPFTIPFKGKKCTPGFPGHNVHTVCTSMPHTWYSFAHLIFNGINALHKTQLLSTQSGVHLLECLFILGKRYSIRCCPFNFWTVGCSVIVNVRSIRGTIVVMINCGTFSLLAVESLGWLTSPIFLIWWWRHLLVSLRSIHCSEWAHSVVI